MRYRYSFLIEPFKLVLDLLAIFLVLYFIADKEYYNLPFILFALFFWTFSSYILKYYSVPRYSNIFRLSYQSLKQILIFSFGFFAFFGIFKEGEIIHNQFKVLLYISIVTLSFRYFFFLSLRIYRTLGYNYRKVVIFGSNNATKTVINMLKGKKYFGYQYMGFFTDKNKNKRIGSIDASFDFVLQNGIDEIYCSLQEFSEQKVNKIIQFSNQNNISIKLIPDYGQLYSKNREVQYYDNSVMIVSVGKLPFQHPENFFIKRIFDFIFSLGACLFILSWVYPLLWILIKIESKGPVIFKQKREGLQGKEFICYKFRSMKLNKEADVKHTFKNDPRITRIGSFIRKTSLDELPQFFNVLKGDMSVVGPRPHVKALSDQYKEEVEADNYIKRYAMKPGVTGLAQVTGYRGEVRNYFDIKNRVRMDIFYIENWSFLLDVKIILMTITNVFKGEDNAY